MKKLYRLDEVAMMSHLTTRTLRSYIKKGILEGSLKNGVWVFSEEQVVRFMDRAEIARRITQKNASIAQNFLRHPNLKGNRLCVILEMDPKDAAKMHPEQFFCEAVTKSEGDITFSSAGHFGRIRIVVEGNEKTVAAVMRQYYERNPEKDEKVRR